MSVAVYAERLPSAPNRRSDLTVVMNEAVVSDGDLIARVARGDRTAFDELHARYARAIFGLALRRLRDRGHAEDAAQDVFSALWRRASTYDPTRGAGAPWLFVVARNVITDHLRKTPPPTAEMPDDLAAGGASPESVAESDWEAWQVHRAVAGLPAHERQLVELAYWGGMSQSEIATFLDIPLGTVKTRTRAALGRLADALTKELQ